MSRYDQIKQSNEFYRGETPDSDFIRRLKLEAESEAARVERLLQCSEKELLVRILLELEALPKHHPHVPSAEEIGRSVASGGRNYP